MLGQLNQTYKTQIQVGNLHFSLSANPIADERGQRLGTVVEWADRTAEVHIENEIASVVDHASAGDFGHRLSTGGKIRAFLPPSRSGHEPLAGRQRTGPERRGQGAGSTLPMVTCRNA
jgi:hypothetical protein